MSDPQHPGLSELGQRMQAMAGPANEPRARNQWEQYQGAPLPVGPATGSRPLPPLDSFDDLRAKPQPPAAAVPPTAPPATDSAHAQTAATPPAANSSASSASAAAAPAGSAPEDPNAPKSGLQRAINAVRSAIPIVQKLLPLLEGNVATVVGALMAPQPVHHPPPPPVKIDLEPVERGLTEVRTGHKELKGQLQEQAVVLKRVEDQLERVREATDRNTLEQQELVEDLRSVGNRISNIAVIGLVLIVVLLGLNLWFLIQLQHILR
jgi:hypothetical protein